MSSKKLLLSTFVPQILGTVSTPVLDWQSVPLGGGQTPAEQPNHSQVIAAGRAIVGFIRRKVNV
jgi:hypothetical protein